MIVSIMQKQVKKIYYETNELNQCNDDCPPLPGIM